MTTSGNALRQPGRTAGTVTALLGGYALLATLWCYVLSVAALYEPLFGTYDVPTWVRAAGLAGIPIGFLGAPIALTAAWRGPGMPRAWWGLGLMLVSLAAFVVLLFWMG